MASVHFPLPAVGRRPRRCWASLYRDLHGRLAAGERMLVHQEELGDRVIGRGGRLPAVVGPGAERPPGHRRARAPDRPPDGPERP